MTSENSPTISSGQVWIISLVFSLLLVVRWYLHPGENPTVGGFSHDSAYLTLVAKNVQAGRGYVNDAHWLVFLQPEALPMPYHNANPLFPTLMAGLASAADLDMVAAGFTVCALASLLLFVGLFRLVWKYGVSGGTALALALAGTLFTPVFEDSLKLVPDTLCSAFAVLCLVCLVRTQGLAAAAAGGVCFGLAWLTRSSVVLMLPALVVYVFLWNGRRLALRRLAVFGSVAFLVALPWLVHTARVWGNPLRSDASYYLWQGYHARAFGDSVERFWHSPQPPPSLGELLRREPGSVALFYLNGVPRVLRELVVEWCTTYQMAIFLGLVALLAVWKIPALTGPPTERQSYRPEVIGLAVYAVTMVLAFAPRWVEFEARYFDVLAILLAVLLAFAGMRAWHDRKDTEPLRWTYNMALLTLSSVLWLYVTPMLDLGAWLNLARPGDALVAPPDDARGRYQALAQQTHERARYLVLARQVHQRLIYERQGLTHLIVQGLGAQAVVPTGPPLGAMAQHLAAFGLVKPDAFDPHERLGGTDPVVVGFSPYFYTFVNGVPALSIPESDDAYLLEYMRRYGARHVFLTPKEVEFWRPHWLKPNGWPPWLHKLDRTEPALVFERRELP